MKSPFPGMDPYLEKRTGATCLLASLSTLATNCAVKCPVVCSYGPKNGLLREKGLR
jgi:hypothetical protein